MFTHATNMQIRKQSIDGMGNSAAWGFLARGLEVARTVKSFNQG